MDELYTKILELLSKLINGDYKIIKCAEALALGQELPYNIEELHEERLIMRNLINIYQQQIDDIKPLEEESEDLIGEMPIEENL